MLRSKSKDFWIVYDRWPVATKWIIHYLFASQPYLSFIVLKSNRTGSSRTFSYSPIHRKHHSNSPNNFNSIAFTTFRRLICLRFSVFYVNSDDNTFESFSFAMKQSCIDKLHSISFKLRANEIDRRVLWCLSLAYVCSIKFIFRCLRGYANSCRHHSNRLITCVACTYPTD